MEPGTWNERALQAVLSEGVLEQLQFKSIGGHQLAWLQGQLALSTQVRGSFMTITLRSMGW